jgi:hypothetical protein
VLCHGSRGEAGRVSALEPIVEKQLNSVQQLGVLEVCAAADRGVGLHRTPWPTGYRASGGRGDFVHRGACDDAASMSGDT